MTQDQRPTFTLRTLGKGTRMPVLRIALALATVGVIGLDLAPGLGAAPSTASPLPSARRDPLAGSSRLAQGLGALATVAFVDYQGAAIVLELKRREASKSLPRPVTPAAESSPARNVIAHGAEILGTALEGIARWDGAIQSALGVPARESRAPDRAMTASLERLDADGALFALPSAAFSDVAVPTIMRNTGAGRSAAEDAFHAMGHLSRACAADLGDSYACTVASGGVTMDPAKGSFSASLLKEDRIGLRPVGSPSVLVAVERDGALVKGPGFGVVGRLRERDVEAPRF